MTDPNVFIDTNILVYAHDISAGEKHLIAQDIIRNLWESNSGVISTQVLQEFFVTVTRKLPKPVDILIAQEIIRDLGYWQVVTIDVNTILAAIDLSRGHRLSFWDALILQAALSAGVRSLLSEDLTDGQIIEGLRVINPFRV